ncbi:MAG: protein translocase subunit SecF, partial [Butyrivibrio sp.]|nr:protein translocase subunit SecF [Butyrivibrio sp.]
MTLTLPGIAGIILSIGMAVDANVLVFARIKEEIASGNEVEHSIKNGYKKAFSAIFDGNFTTFVVALFLFWLGTGSIKGFGSTLMLGTVVSMFTALVITRIISQVLFGLGLKNPKLYGKAKPVKVIDFIGKRKIFYAISALVIVVGIVTMAVNAGVGKGAFNYSLDFVGGTSTTVTFDREWTAAELDAEVVPKIEEVTGVSEVQVQTVTGTNEVIFKTTTLSVEQRSAMEDMLIADYGIDEAAVAAETISSTISSEMRADAIKALTIALLFILLYIWIRFRDITLGASAIVALAHDALVIVTSYALIRLSVGSTFIAVVLTIIGYSINDTIVTFDRIRENRDAHEKRADRAELVNQSVSQTLTRSLFTSATTFFMVLSLFIFGVTDIRAFALPLMVGVLCGTYSSIFIASPLWFDFKNHFGSKKG